MRAVIILIIILIAATAIPGCTSSPPATPSYSVNNNGVLSVTCAPVTTTENMLFSNETYTESRVVLHTQTGDVVTYPEHPKQPKAVMVYIPGAGRKYWGMQSGW